MKKDVISLPRIGMRIIKSALGVLICFAIYLLRGKQGTPFYSALAVLWCIQNQTRNTLGNAIQRTVGTFIGAVYGLVYILIKLRFQVLGDTFWHYTIISLSLVPIIYTTVVINQKKASYFSCVVYLSIVVNHLMDENPYLFVFNRSLDTLIGIFVGLVMNSVHFHGKMDKDTLFVASLDKAMEGSSGGCTPYSQVAIRNMLEDGISLTFMTGKTPAGFMEKMPDIKPKLPIIALNGAILYDMSENRYPIVYVISAPHASSIEEFIESRGINVFSTVVLEDVLIIYHKKLKNEAEKDIYNRLHKSPYRNYLCKDRPGEHPVVYMMCIDETDKIERLLSDLEYSRLKEELKILTYPSEKYPGYSYLKIYSKNASIQNMIDYLKTIAGVEREVSVSDMRTIPANLYFDDCDRMIRKIGNMFYWGKEIGREPRNDIIHRYI